MTTTTATTASPSASSRRLTRREVDLPEAFRALFQPFRYKAFYGGRGSGKSHAMATALLLLSAQRPLRILAARETQKSIRDSSKRLLDDRIAALGLSRRYTSTETEIRARNGSLFLFAGLGQNPDQIKSMAEHARIGVAADAPTEPQVASTLHAHGTAARGAARRSATAAGAVVAAGGAAVPAAMAWHPPWLAAGLALLAMAVVAGLMLRKAHQGRVRAAAYAALATA